MWEYFEHQADVGVRGLGASKEEAFAEAACALSELTTALEDVTPEQAVPIRCEAGDDETLLVEWLDAIVYEMATRGMVFSRFDVTIGDGTLSGTAWGERRDDARHTVGVEVKGPTFTELRVSEDPEGHWLAQLVVDV